MVEFRDRCIDDVTINSILLCLYIKQIDSKFSNVVTWDLFVKLIKSFKPAKCGTINVRLPRVIKITRIVYLLPFKAPPKSKTDFFAYLFALYSFARIE